MVSPTMGFLNCCKLLKFKDRKLGMWKKEATKKRWKTPSGIKHKWDCLQWKFQVAPTFRKKSKPSSNRKMETLKHLLWLGSFWQTPCPDPRRHRFPFGQTLLPPCLACLNRHHQWRRNGWSSDFASAIFGFPCIASLERSCAKSWWPQVLLDPSQVWSYKAVERHVPRRHWQCHPSEHPVFASPTTAQSGLRSFGQWTCVSKSRRQSTTTICPGFQYSALKNLKRSRTSRKRFQAQYFFRGFPFKNCLMFAWALAWRWARNPRPLWLRSCQAEGLGHRWSRWSECSERHLAWHGEWQRSGGTQSDF